MPRREHEPDPLRASVPRRAGAVGLGRQRERAVGLVLVVFALAACPAREAPPNRERLTVFAASSLTESFADLERAFEARFPGVDVELAFAGSQALRLQVEQGAPADVFASANAEHMGALADAGLVASPSVFAESSLVVIVPTDAADGPTSFADLPNAERIVLAAETVPAGRYARQVIARADADMGGDFAVRVYANVVSEEANVRLVRAKVALGEADAAVVYRTDAIASDGVRLVAIPDSFDARAAYSIAAVIASEQREIAAEFVAFIHSEEGQQLLRARGFSTP